MTMSSDVWYLATFGVSRECFKLSETSMMTTLILLMVTNEFTSLLKKHNLKIVKVKPKTTEKAVQ